MSEPEEFRIQPQDRDREIRRQIMRRSSLYTAAVVAAALAIASLGAAIVAWVLSGRGMPFGVTWLVTMGIIVLPGLLAAIWKLIRAR